MPCRSFSLLYTGTLVAVLASAALVLERAAVEDLSFSRSATFSPVAGRTFVAEEFPGDAKTGAVSPFHPAVPEGGRAVAIAVHPFDSNHILVASETGGLFRTTDGGSNWVHVPELPNHWIWDVEFAPNNSSIVVAAAASNFPTRPDGGIWLSTDGGYHWRRPAGAVPPSGPRCTERPAAYDVSFERPGSGATVYVATDCGLAISGDGGTSWRYTVCNPSVPVNHDRTQDAVWSVLGLPGRVVIAGADGVCLSTTAGNNWQRTRGGPVIGQRGINHGFAASPINTSHIFHAGGGQRLFLSIDGGLDWTQVPAPSTNNRGVFVRAGRALSGSLNQIEVYFGDGTALHRQTFRQFNDALIGSGSWTEAALDHADPADIGFNIGGIPILLATDGGVHRSPDRGRSWTLAGGGTGGFNAIQINDVTGQAVTGVGAHRDLYYGAHDNGIAASADGGATWPFRSTGDWNYIRVLPTVASHANTRLTAVGCVPCSNHMTDAHLGNDRAFPSAPDDDATPGDSDGTPFLIGAGAYVQNTIDNDLTTPLNTFRVTRDDGRRWRIAFTIPQELRGIPLIAGRSSDPVLYQAVRRPGSTKHGFERIGLARVSNFLRRTGTVTDAGGNGQLGSLGMFPLNFPIYFVFAANPQNPDHVIAADVETDEMKFSVDGGRSWHVDGTLTDLATARGNFLFSAGQLSHVRVIGFDPYNPCLILVGTDQNGIIKSKDGGSSWSQVEQSEALTMPSSFYFPPDGAAIVSTFGRGLWTLNDRSAAATCRPPLPRSAQRRVATRAIDLRTGSIAPFRGLRDHQICPTCAYLIVRHGVITGVDVEGGRLIGVSISSGAIYQVDRDGQEVPLAIPNRYSTDPSSFDNLPSVRSALAPMKRGGIRALVVDRDTLINAIVSEEEIAFQAARSPYIRLSSDNMAGGAVRVPYGGRLVVSGEGFAPSQGAQNPVTVLVDGEMMARDVDVDPAGNFRVEIEVRRMPGEHAVVVEQQEGRRLVRERSSFRVVTVDRK